MNLKVKLVPYRENVISHDKIISPTVCKRLHFAIHFVHEDRLNFCFLKKLTCCIVSVALNANYLIRCTIVTYCTS